MLEKLRAMAEKLTEVREEARAALLKGDSKAARAAQDRIREAEEAIFSLTREVKDRRLRKALEMKFADGAAPVSIQFILGLSRSSYYRLMKGAERL